MDANGLTCWCVVSLYQCPPNALVYIDEEHQYQLRLLLDVCNPLEACYAAAGSEACPSTNHSHSDSNSDSSSSSNSCSNKGSSAGVRDAESTQVYNLMQVLANLKLDKTCFTPDSSNPSLASAGGNNGASSGVELQGRERQEGGEEQEEDEQEGEWVGCGSPGAVGASSISSGSRLSGSSDLGADNDRAQQNYLEKVSESFPFLSFFCELIPPFIHCYTKHCTAPALLLSKLLPYVIVSTVCASALSSSSLPSPSHTPHHE